MNMQIQSPDSWILPVWFAETTLVAAALAAAAWLASRSNRLGPTARHVLWLVVLVRFVVPPVVHWPWALLVRNPSGSSSAAQLDEGAARQVLQLDIREFASADVPEPPPMVPPPLPAEPIGPGPAVVEVASASIELPPSPPSDVNLPLPADPVAPKSLTFRAELASEVWDPRRAGMALACAWLVGSLVVASVQAMRIVRFRRRLKPGLAVPASDWLIGETARIAAMLGVRPPPVRIVPGLTTPMLWCLGRPLLLIPRHLLKELDVSCWRGILTHELAHLRRGDHWVSRLELAAGLVWWWNPLYWLVRGRLDAEAELACDAWVVSLLPEDRLTYADSLFQLCSELPHQSSTAIRVPALGVTGSGKFFEKRLTMILSDSVSCRATAWNALAAALLMLASVPAWTLAEPPETTSLEVVVDELETIEAEPAEPADKPPAAPAAPAPPVPPAAPAAPVPPAAPAAPDIILIQSDDGKFVHKTDASFSTKSLQSKQKTKKAVKAETLKKNQDKDNDDFDVDGDAIAEKVEAVVEKIVEKAFGPEFEKKMEALGKDMEKKFGPGSDFEKLMEKMGKDLEKQLGPGSEFEKTIKAQLEKVKAEASKAALSTRSVNRSDRPEKSAKGKTTSIPAHPSDGPKIAKEDEAKAAKAREHAKEDKAKAEADHARVAHDRERAIENYVPPASADDEKVANEDKAKAEADHAKAREDHARTMIERKAAQVRGAEARAIAAKERDRTRRIKLLEDRLKKLMEELKQLETEDQQAGG